MSRMRAELSNDLNAPGAVAAVDEWARTALADGRAAAPDGSAAALVSDAVNALLGVEL